MHLLEAILAANHRALAGDKSAGLRPSEYSACLPLVALTCIDPRLNRLLPEVLGISEEDFIWLRNAGNIITGPMSSTMRPLALACAVKGGKEIVIIGHTDCKVRQTTTLDLTDGFKRAGVERGRLPDNLNEFFGLFASENQNVIRAADFVRQSPLIGPEIPVHGLMVDIGSGKLDWVVNGYQALESARTAKPAPTPGTAPGEFALPVGSFAAFELGEMKFPDLQIGEVAATIPAAVTTREPVAATAATSTTPQAQSQPAQPQRQRSFKLDPLAMFKVVGEDQKIYGPVTGAEIEQWMAEGRIALDTLAQRLGYKEWKQLAAFGHTPDPPKIPLPPPVNPQEAQKHPSNPDAVKVSWPNPPESQKRLRRPWDARRKR
jgi:carbonic anhydrase